MKKLLLFFSATFLLTLLGCQGSSGSKTPEQDSLKVDSADSHAGMAHDYTCPMHPDQHSAGPGKCPLCGMDMVHTDGAKPVPYTMTFATNPATVEANKPFTLSLKPVVVGKESEAVALDLHHEKKIHLIMVSSDLQWFTHVHPEYQQSGSYDLGQTFPSGGEYLLYADYLPSGGTQQLGKHTLHVAGKPGPVKVFDKAQLTAKAGDYTIVLSIGGDKFLTGVTQHIAAKITKAGKTVDPNSLEDYLGAKAHVVVIGLQSKDYLHVHPGIEGDHLDLHATFEESGVYRMWLQFQAAGIVHTADFVLIVDQGSPTQSAHDPGHMHDTHQH